MGRTDNARFPGVTRNSDHHRQHPPTHPQSGWFLCANRVLECAVAAGSQFIVTGDTDLLDLGHYSGIQIVRVADFMKLLSSP